MSSIFYCRLKKLLDYVTNGPPVVIPPIPPEPVPTLDFNPASGVFASTIGPTPAFSRASAATYINAAGLIQLTAINVPRITYDPITHECLGYLAEEQRTNNILQSSAFNVTPWSPFNSSVAANSTIAPDGTMSACLSSITVAGGALQQSMTLPAGAYTASCYVKPATSEWFSLSIYDGAHHPVWFHLVGAGSVGAVPSANSPTITALPNGWYRVSVSWTTVASPPYWSAYFTDADNASAPVGASGHVWGAAFEAGSFPTSYIPTTTAAATRSADLCSISGADFTGFYNQTEGTLVSQAICKGITQAAIVGQVITQVTGEYLDAARYHDTLRVYSQTGPTVYLNIDSMIPAGNSDRSATAYKLNDAAFAANGSLVGVDNDFLTPTVEKFEIGTGFGGTYHVNGTIARLQYFPERLPDAKLIELTQP